MAQSNVAFLSTPEYPQHVSREIERIEQMVSRAFATAELSCDSKPIGRSVESITAGRLATNELRRCGKAYRDVATNRYLEASK